MKPMRGKKLYSGGTSESAFRREKSRKQAKVLAVANLRRAQRRPPTSSSSRTSHTCKSASTPTLANFGTPSCTAAQGGLRQRDEKQVAAQQLLTVSIPLPSLDVYCGRARETEHLKCVRGICKTGVRTVCVGDIEFPDHRQGDIREHRAA
ncbi:hypothetical protein IE81DRAFT_141333 [Ceraceosorus guamensis]|uniref:Uncharacterized protein n=1 Tax=Ceraceosorus guamensis TaxID=1522189 RepID=A0A316W0J7_9BASI|nr:hypothetical protein IE81DRAFT_141333 [Ceraceosorus guamensis]PWN42243.1 hypothetical protein IE81DRAFT_141333 [Ceraceosorus guamensis]